VEFPYSDPICNNIQIQVFERKELVGVQSERETSFRDFIFVPVPLGVAATYIGPNVLVPA
jgi:hypothetical protein